jgi:hypothetical protein
MVFSTTWLELKEMAQDPLVRREPVSASCNRRPDEGLETHTYSLYPTEHPANCPLRWSSVMVLGCISHDCKLDLVTIQGNLPLATRPVYMDDNARPHHSRAVTTYLQSEAVTSVPWPAMNGLESRRACLGHVRLSYTGSGTSCAKLSSVGSNIASGMAAVITTGHPTSNWRVEKQG